MRSNKIEPSNQSTSRNIKKTLRQNLAEKLKNFGVQNNNPITSNFILQAINNKNEKVDENSELMVNAQKVNFSSNPEPSSFEVKTRESTNQDSQKITSRKNMIKVQDSRKFSKDILEDISRHSKPMSLSESVAKISNQGSMTTRFAAQKRTSNASHSQDNSAVRNETNQSRKEVLVLAQPLSPEESNPQQPSFPRKTWPMKPGYCIKTFSKELTEYEKGEILQYRKIYYVGTKAKKIKGAPWNEFNYGYDDDKNDYIVVVGDHMAYRYEIVESLGKGSFGHVLK